MKKQLQQTKNIPPILIFNSLRRLVGKANSMSTVSKLLQVSTTNVLYACAGKSISCQGYYLRTQDESIEITDEDFGVLKLEEYDEMNGENRKYYKTKVMVKGSKTTTTHDLFTHKNKNKK